MRPLIGITTYGADEDQRFTLPREYVDAVRRAGGLPLLVPPVAGMVEDVLSRVDALILAGGGDLDPAHYGGRPHETIYNLNRERDEFELELARLFLGTGRPLLGICRGMQTLNVALGGTLIEHLPDVVGETVLHRLPPREPGRHAVRVAQDSRLAAILGEPEFVSATWHHQAVRRPAEGLRIVAHAPDGTVEAAEMPEHPWLIAVQWHPELTAAEDPVQQRLFDDFIRAAITLRDRP
jgi:putative glutamine amidotransferase